MGFHKKNKVNTQTFMRSNKLLEANFFNIKNFSFFIKKYNFRFFFYDYKKIFIDLKKLLFILSKVHRTNKLIFFVGLNPKDSLFYSRFNDSLKLLASRNGHLYVDFLTKGQVYDHWSFFKRQSIESFTETNLPHILVTFSRSTSELSYKEFSSSGIPVFYFLGEISDSNSIFKDYPLFGIYSKKMLSFYLDLLNYCFAKFS
jgi:hypothetical protein